MGTQGFQGRQGPQGNQGPTGIQGTAGTNGTNGSTGPPGPSGGTGPQGAAGIVPGVTKILFGADAITANIEKDITFSSPFSSTPTITCTHFGFGNVSVLKRSTTGFQGYASATGTMMWIAIN